MHKVVDNIFKKQSKETSRSRKVPTSIDKETGEKYLNFSYMLLSDAAKKLGKLTSQGKPRSLKKRWFMTLLRLKIVLELLIFEVSYFFSSRYARLRLFYRYVTKHLPQKIKRGFSDEELWNLDANIVDFVSTYLAPRIQGFIDMSKTGYPASLNSMQEWIEILNTIQKGFAIIKREGILDPYGLTDEETQQVKDSIELFSKYWTNLWD